MSKVTESIENNPLKNRTRAAINQQAKELGVPISSLSLPAEHWEFEKLLLKSCEVVKMQGIEKNDAHPEIYAASLRNKPAMASLCNCLIGEADMTGVNLAWFDYCGPAYGGVKWGLSRITEVANAIRKMIDNNQSGLVYATYCLFGRPLSDQEYGDALWGGDGLTIQGKIMRRLWSEIGIKKGNGVHHVMEVKYLGGSMQKTPMLTVGFQVGKQTVTPLFADWSFEVKTARAQAHAEKYGGDFISPDQEAKIETFVDQANKEWEISKSAVQAAQAKLEEQRKELEAATEKLRTTLMYKSTKNLIRFAHKQGLNTAAIHKVTKLLPEGCPDGNTFTRHATRRNVGATVAWAHERA
jgi:hypothetical protein